MKNFKRDYKHKITKEFSTEVALGSSNITEEHNQIFKKLVFPCCLILLFVISLLLACPSRHKGIPLRYFLYLDINLSIILASNEENSHVYMVI